MTVRLHKGDLPDEAFFGDCVGDRRGDARNSCQVATGCASSSFRRAMERPTSCRSRPGRRARPISSGFSPTANITKLFHFARFDLAVLFKTFGVMAGPVYCTKIASKLARTYTDRHGLKDLTRELLGLEISKQQQSSDWGSDILSDAQLAYAASDVLHLHALRARLDGMLKREGRFEIAEACFGFLPARARLDVMGWADTDIFSLSNAIFNACGRLA